METHNFFEKCVRVLTTPILNALPSVLIKKAMRATSHDAATVVAKGGSTHALEAMYTRYHRKLFSRGFFQGIADIFWHHFVSQPKALRNRLQIVQMLLEEEIRNNATRISVLSIAGGSARAFIHTLSKLSHEEPPKLARIVVVDKDTGAIQTGERLATSAGLADSCEWINGNAGQINSLVPNRYFEVVEIVGLLDYFDDERTTRLLSNIKTVMRENGTLIVANVIPNSEMSFVKKTGWPPMFYRTPENFAQLVSRAGFSVRDTIEEPLGVHTIVRARKL